MPVTQGKQIFSLSQAARSLGVDRKTVADLVRVREIPTQAHPNNGKARAIDLKALRTLERAIKGR
jgi:hypothetical protein